MAEFTSQTGKLVYDREPSDALHCRGMAMARLYPSREVTDARVLLQVADSPESKWRTVDSADIKDQLYVAKNGSVAKSRKAIVLTHWQPDAGPFFARLMLIHSDADVRFALRSVKA